MAKRPVFVREATGLVREISPFNAFVTTLQTTGLPTGVATMLPFVPFVWPGADQALALVLVLPIMLVHSAMYVLLAWAMPRSGGDYVWTGRTLHPALGTSLSLTFVIYQVIFAGSFASFAITYGVGSLSVAVAIATGNPGLVSYYSGIFTNTFWIAVFATLLIVYSTIVMIPGLRFYLRQQLLFWVIGLVGTVIAIGLLVGVTPAQFATAFDKNLGSYKTYQGIIDLAASSGFSWKPSLAATLSALSFAWLINNGYQFAGYYSGELKGVRNSMIASSMGNNLFCTLVYASFAFFFVSAVGNNWLHSIAFLAYGQPSSYNLPVSLNPYFFAGLLSNNLLVIVLVNFAIVAGAITLISSVNTAVTRIMLAMSFDRVLPTKLADVSDRFHTPVKAILLTNVGCWLGMMAALYYGFIFANLNYTLMYTIVLAIGGITALVFPYRRKQLFEGSPVARYKLGRIPLISVLGVASFILFAYLSYSAGLNPVVGGPVSVYALSALLLTFIGCGLLYFLAAAYHKRKGLDLTLTFREIPPE